MDSLSKTLAVVVLSFSCFGASACSGANEQAASAPASSPAPPLKTPDVPPTPPASQQTTPLGAPFVLEVKGPDSVAAGATIEVTAHVTRAAPVELHYVVKVPAGVLPIGGPAGVEVDEGSVKGTIPVGRDPVSLTFKFEVATVPAEDLEVHVVHRGPSSGAKAVKRYAFGRGGN